MVVETLKYWPECPFNDLFQLLFQILFYNHDMDIT